MFCKYCGKQIADESQFCPYCGSDITSTQDADEAQDAPQQVTPEDAPQRSAEEAAAPIQQEPYRVDENPSEQAEPAQESASYVPAAATVAAPPSTDKPRKSKKRAVIAIAAIVVVAIAAVAVWYFMFRGPSQGVGEQGAPSALSYINNGDVRNAISDAADATQTVESTVSKLNSAESISSDDLQTLYDECSTAGSKIASDRKVVQNALNGASGNVKSALEIIDAAMSNAQDTVDFQVNFADATSINGVTDDINAYYNAIVKAEDNVSSLDAPEGIESTVQSYAKMLGLIDQAVYSYLAEKDTLATVEYYSLAGVMEWSSQLDTDTTTVLVDYYDRQLTESLAVLDGTRLTSDEGSIDVSMIESVNPNLYDTVDGVAILYATEPMSGKSIDVTCKIEGLTQEFNQRYDLAQGVNRIVIKPAILTSGIKDDVDSQLDITITDPETNEVLVQKSQTVKVLDHDSVTWESNEFTHVAPVDILAWMRPESENVDAVNRLAAEYVNQWTNSQYDSVAGYQYGDDDYWMTLVQASAIQKAVSDLGVRYVDDAYSFDADQSVKTPDEVLESKQAICIESSLLMASCLQRAGFHVMLVFPPGHAQVAVESYSGSGEYYLLETTTLPYDGLTTGGSFTDFSTYNGFVVSGIEDDDSWDQYFSSVITDDSQTVDVIDCNFATAFGIKGIDID